MGSRKSANGTEVCSYIYLFSVLSLALLLNIRCHLKLTIDPEATPWSEDSHFNNKWCWNNWTSMSEEISKQINLDLKPSHLIKIISNGSQTKCKTLKSFQLKQCEEFQDMTFESTVHKRKSLYTRLHKN